MVAMICTQSCHKNTNHMLFFYILSLRVAGAIPRVIYQTYHTPAGVPPSVAAQWGRYAPGWPRHVFDDSACVNLLRSHFSEKYVGVFDRLQGAHRADLCRYAIMFSHGGVYADIKFKLLVPLAEIVDLAKNASISTVEAYNGKMLHQGFIIAVPRQALFLKLMAHMQSTVLSARSTSIRRLQNTCLPKFVPSSICFTSSARGQGSNMLFAVPNLPLRELRA